MSVDLYIAIFIILLFIQWVYFQAKEVERKKYFLIQVCVIGLMTLLEIIKEFALYHYVPLPVIFFALALTLSFIGDLFMARIIRVTSKKLIDGIIGFSLAHVFYIMGLFLTLQENGKTIDILDFAVMITFIIIGESIYAWISMPVSVTTLRVGSALYAGLLLIMTGEAFLIFYSMISLSSAFLVMGASFFLASDFLIAVREFRLKKGRHETINNILRPLYVFGQYLLQTGILVMFVSKT